MVLTEDVRLELCKIRKSIKTAGFKPEGSDLIVVNLIPSNNGRALMTMLDIALYRQFNDINMFIAGVERLLDMDNYDQLHLMSSYTPIQIWEESAKNKDIDYLVTNSYADFLSYKDKTLTGLYLQESLETLRKVMNKEFEPKEVYKTLKDALMNLKSLGILPPVGDDIFQ